MGPNRLSDVPTVIGDGVLSQRETDGGTARTLSRYLPRPFSGLRCGSVHNSWRVMWRMSMVEVVIFIALVVRENAALRLRPRLPHSLSRVGPVQHFSERVHWRRRPEAHQAPRSGSRCSTAKASRSLCSEPVWESIAPASAQAGPARR